MRPVLPSVLRLALVAAIVPIAAPLSANAQQDGGSLPPVVVAPPKPSERSGVAPQRKPSQAARTRRQAARQQGAAVAGGAGAAAPTTQPSLDRIVVTPTGRPERQSEIAGTTQVIDQETIQRSAARSLTDLLSENAVGFFSEWTPGQTSINIRGGATDGQGKDFKGQVAVLINGRRAGTANLSKLSPADVERIEVVRGPASVIYGSQNIGGVINIIMKTGRTAQGTLVEGTTGAWNLMQGRAQTGGVYEGFDYYLGVSGGKRDDYHVGGGRREINTDWKRQGIAGAFGWQLNPDHRVELQVRHDGIYDAGFRGSGANYLSRDDRYNGSVEASYSGKTPDGTASWFTQFYAVSDTDRFKWASPVIRSGNVPARGTAADWNTRNLDILGTRVQPRFQLFHGNELLLGWDWEESTLRNDRFRVGVPGNPLSQVSPQDNNQRDHFHALYAEDTQRLFDERLILRAGIRQTWGVTKFEETPYLTGAKPNSRSYEATTYSVGATAKATDWLSFRVGASSGFRAPTATELAADFTTLGGGRIFGTATLKPETSDQIEAGATLSGRGWRLDGAVFQNIIHDRITTRLRAGQANTSDYINNPGDVFVRGVELQYDQDMLTLLGLSSDLWRWKTYANGNYNFDMKDKGSLTVASANTHNVERVYRYQAAVGTRFGTSGTAHDWTIQVQGVFRGPVYYNTEENLLVPAAEPYREYIWKKSPFATVNVRGEIALAKDVQLYVQVTNLFDVNNHPLFIANDKYPVIADTRFFNGGIGTSMPGRDIQVGLKARF
jgi:vitamin B12 transporter